jgi:hypothetical protein
VLDYVQRRRFLVQPARKDAAPALVGTFDVDLNEGPGELLLFPRSRGFARPQPHDDIFPARRLTGMQRNILHDAVALVEDRHDRDPLRHWCHSGLVGRWRSRVVRRTGGVTRLLSSTACGQGQREQQGRESGFHAYSGIHGS